MYRLVMMHSITDRQTDDIMMPTEADLDTFIMFGQQGSPQDRECQRQQCNIFWLVGPLVETFISSLGAARHSLAWRALYAVLQSLKFSTLFTHLFPKQKANIIWI